MSLKLGDTAPDFNATTTQGEINFYEFLGDKWGILFSHPANFTPVCTTELGEVSRLKSEFEKRNTQVIALSVDPIESHFRWLGDIEETQKTVLNYPIIADENKNVSTLYDMIQPGINEKLTVRSVFFISPDKKVKLIITYPPSTGRNFHEILRVLDSLQLTANYSVATPVNWEQGEDVVILPSISNEEADIKFPKGYKTVKPYLRYTAQPDLVD
jgi:alkyl hydroperoxide reductase subunit AhpC